MEGIEIWDDSKEEYFLDKWSLGEEDLGYNDDANAGMLASVANQIFLDSVGTTLSSGWGKTGEEALESLQKKQGIRGEINENLSSRFIRENAGFERYKRV